MMRTTIIFSALWAISAAAAEPSQKTPTDSERLAAFRAIKIQALQTEATFELQSHPALSSSSGLARVYVGGAGSGMELRHVALTLDDSQVINADVSVDAAHILRGSTPLLWLSDLNLAGGPHQLHAELTVQDGAKTESPEQTLTSDQEIPDGTGINSLTLRPAAGKLFSHDQVALTEGFRRQVGEDWLAQTVRKIHEVRGNTAMFSPGSNEDPEVSFASYLELSGDTDAAAVRLLAIPAAQDAQFEMPATYWLRTAELLRESDLPDQSEAICDRLDREGLEKSAIGVERLRDGVVEYNEGNTPVAESQFKSARPRLPEDRVQDWQLASALILFDRGDWAGAREVLKDQDNESTEAFRYSSQMSKAVLTTGLRHYNLAVAMLKTGEEKQGLSLLDILGRMKSFDPEILALRDKANIALGWHFLKKKQGTTAMGVLGRVRSEGEFSNEALLGMGWAQLAPGGERISRVRFDRPTESALTQVPAPIKYSLSQLGAMDSEMAGDIGPRSFEKGDPPADHDEGLRRALHVWQVLADRESSDPAVQEGQLAMGYAYAGLQDEASARDAYYAAIGSLEAARREIDDEAARIRAGSVPTDIAGADSTVAVREGDKLLSSGHGNRTLYNTLTRMRALERLLDGVETYTDQAEPGAVDSSRTKELQAALKKEYVAQRKMIEPIALTDLSGRRRVLDSFLQAAYFSAARATDRVAKN